MVIFRGDEVVEVSWSCRVNSIYTVCNPRVTQHKWRTDVNHLTYATFGAFHTVIPESSIVR